MFFDDIDPDLLVFQKELENMHVKAEYASWNHTRLFKFKQWLAELFKRDLPINCKVEFTQHKHEQTGERYLQIRVITNALGNLSTYVKVDFLEHPRCPGDFPNQIVDHFAKNFKQKQAKIERAVMSKNKK